MFCIPVLVTLLRSVLVRSAPPSFPLYDPLLHTAVNFTSSDAAFDGLFHHAEAQEALNVHAFLNRSLPPAYSSFNIVEEGAQFHAAWLETQPMGGAMYATRNSRVALNNQLVFMRTQRSDGALPGQVGANPAGGAAQLRGDFKAIQGLFFAAPAIDMAWYVRGKASAAAAYLDELAASLAAYDAWLWSTRNTSAMCRPHSIGCASSSAVVRHKNVSFSSSSACCAGEGAGRIIPRRGLLWSIGVADSGEDSSTRYCVVANHTVPFAPCVVPYAMPIQSAGVTSYSYACRAALQRIALARGDAHSAAHWRIAAKAVAATLKTELWDPSRAAMFDRDGNDTTVTTLVHDNLRYMWQGAFDDAMADAFVTTHLMNRSEFWTPTPLPSIAYSDRRYNAIADANTWSGRPMGLTFQRTIRALERYGHHAEVTLIGARLAAAILGYDKCATNATRCHFTLEIDPITSKPMAAPWAPKDGYGPMLLAFLEYSALRLGVVPRAPDASMGPLRAGKMATLLWSGGAPVDAQRKSSSTYTQTLGEVRYSLEIVEGATIIGRCNGDVVFKSTAGVRVVTDLDGVVLGIVGMSSITINVTLAAQNRTAALTVRPNEEWGVSKGTEGFKLLRRSAFVMPFS